MAGLCPLDRPFGSAQRRLRSLTTEQFVCKARAADGILSRRTPSPLRSSNDQEVLNFRVEDLSWAPSSGKCWRSLWSHGSATVRELLADGNIRQAYTTVMTTMDRLYKKGLLDRVAEGRAFRYTPRHTSEELQRVTALESIRQLLGSGDASSLPLSYLVEALSTHDAQLLDELQLLVERKRRELQRREPNGRSKDREQR